MMTTIAQTLYLFAPLFFAAVLSAVVLRFDLLRFCKRPVDAGMSLRGRRLFGDSKTWRGFLVAAVGCSAAVAVQKHVLAPHVGALALVRYDDVSALAFGSAMGVGAMLGELPNSFVKRRVGIDPGKTTTGPLSALFYVWDQVDLLTGAWPLIAIWLRPPPHVVTTSFALALVLHPSISFLGWLVGARKTAR